MSNILLNAADVLEKTAALIDAQEVEKTAAVKNERKAVVKLLSDKYAETTGEALSDEVVEKLAASSDDILTTVQQMIEKTAGAAVESMGRSSQQRDSAVPVSKKEAANAAWDRFGSFLTS